MKKTMNAMLMLVLACTMSAFAQTDMSSDSSMKKSDHKMMGKKMSMKGCIMEKDGKYMMMNKEHPDGVGLMSSEDLKPHVGHKVAVKGMMEKMEKMEKMDDMSSGSMNSEDKMKKDDTMKSDDKMKHEGMGMMEMKVSSMKMMSEHCDEPKMMDKMNK